MGEQRKASLGGLSRHTRVAQARALRAASTPAEARFWSIVRGGRIDGLRFRRQQQIGTWIVDFYCHELRLIVELAGSVHDLETVKKRDAARQADLERLGFRFCELINQVVLNSPKAAETELRHYILLQCPAPPPLGEGGTPPAPLRRRGRVGAPTP